MKGLMKATLPFPKLKKDTKVRAVYDTSEIEPGTVLIITTDRISAYDVVMKSLVYEKGKYLNQISAYWFKQTKKICPNHFITDKFDLLPQELKEELKPYKVIIEGRMMFAQKAEEIFPIECIVRGRLLGSAWKAYQEFQI